MTPQAQRIACAEMEGRSDLHVITKNGSYYRENAAGYTNSIAEAWKLPLAEAKKYEMYADRPDVPFNEKVLLHPAPVDRYDEDANAAMRLCGVMRERGWSGPEIHWNDDGEWTCAFYRDGKTPTSIEEDWVITAEGAGLTLPLAIVTAALRATGRDSTGDGR